MIRIGYAGKARIHVDVVRIGLAHVERLVAGVVDEIVTRKDEALGLVGHAVLFELMDRIEREVVHCVAEEFDVDLAVAEGFGQGVPTSATESVRKASSVKEREPPSNLMPVVMLDLMSPTSVAASIT